MDQKTEIPPIDYTDPPFHYVNAPEEIANWNASDSKDGKLRAMSIHPFHKINFSPETINSQEFEALVYASEDTIEVEERSERAQERVPISDDVIKLIKSETKMVHDYILAESHPELKFLSDAFNRIMPGSITLWDDGRLTIHTDIMASDLGSTLKGMRKWLGVNAEEKLVKMVLERLIPKQERD